MDNKILRNVTYSTCALSVILFLLGAKLQLTFFSAIVFANSFMLMIANNNGLFMGLKKNTAVTITILYLIIFDYFFIFEMLLKL